jgi:anthranilate synthase
MSQLRYTTPHGITVTRTKSKIPYRRGLDSVLKQLDSKRGIYLSSGYEYPERYSRWDIASVAPPVEIVGRDRTIEIRALNERGRVLNQMFLRFLEQHPHWQSFQKSEDVLVGELRPLSGMFSEEERSKQPSPISILRAFLEEFRHAEDTKLVLAGAFGYDLLLQFDPIRLRHPRGDQKTLHLLFCDEVFFMDRKKELIERFRYDFSADGISTEGLPHKATAASPSKPSGRPLEITSDHTPEEYMEKVEVVREGMRLGNYYEVILRQTFSAPFEASPSELFRRIQKTSPSPYEFILQMGDEQLVGASPEMFVRVEGKRVESCPISGTARRSGDPIRDADAIRDLLASTKEESELTMCTDVDRNDKSRVCVPGSVRVIGRRLIEAYAGLFHTVDHVEGTLMEGFDSLDAFLTHMWAVTIIGAPKKAAAQAIEDLEKDARGWYGGAVGVVGMNGDINTGILIRTVHLKNGEARYSAGATILYDSVPALEEQETRLKATNFFRALRPPAAETKAQTSDARKVGTGIKLLLIDNEDCFIHTLANYARQTGATVLTFRAGIADEVLDQVQPDIVLVSPGPGRPGDFGVPQLIRKLADRAIPTFGVCLGLQGIVEAFGGQLDVLGYPVHGKGSQVTHQNSGVFRDLPSPFKVGRYHSLYANRETFPACLQVTAESEDGIIMGVRHRDLPIEAVQFHPESLLTLEQQNGLRLIENMIELYAKAPAGASGD